MKKMLILRGIKGTFNGIKYPNGALDEASALEYAKRRGYEGHVLDVSGEAYQGSQQMQDALAVLKYDPEIKALYGFSGGGYNIRHILNAFPAAKQRIELVVVLGAPGNPKSVYDGPWELVYRKDPPQGHMAGPKQLLAELTSPQSSA